MSITSLHAAQANLAQLIEDALRGEEVLIAAAGKPMVRLAPVAPERPPVDRKKFFGALKGQFAFDWDEWKRMDQDIEKLFNEGPIFPDETAR